MSTWLNDSGNEEDFGDERGSHAHITCKYCGERGLVWLSVNGNWKLAYPGYDGGGFHECLKNRSRNVTPQQKAVIRK